MDNNPFSHTVIKSRIKTAVINKITKAVLKENSYPKAKPRNSALNPKIPFNISSLLKPIMNANRFIKTIAVNPHNPTKGEKNVTIKIIAAKTLFNEKNIRL